MNQGAERMLSKSPTPKLLIFDAFKKDFWDEKLVALKENLMKIERTWVRI